MHRVGRKVLGFDIEWRVTFVLGQAPNPAATVQLCAAETCAVIQLSALGDESLPPCLLDLLADARVLKVGVGASGDARRLELDYASIKAGRRE